ncbi:MAG: Mut7-C RNAse domain-containing protein, partial [Thermoplasmata archaeon]
MPATTRSTNSGVNRCPTTSRIPFVPNSLMVGGPEGRGVYDGLWAPVVGMTDEPRWIVDEMLGRLARYLRFLGYDTE